MQIETTTATVYTIQLTDAEVGEILADDAAFLAELRARRNALAAQGPNRRKSLSLGKGARASDAPKAEASGSGRKTAQRQPCPKCGRMCAPQGMPKHLKACTGARTQA
jgi:hypothetical protein